MAKKINSFFKLQKSKMIWNCAHKIKNETTAEVAPITFAKKEILLKNILLSKKFKSEFKKIIPGIIQMKFLFPKIWRFFE